MSEGVKHQIDPESDEFQAVLEKTVTFTDKVINQFKWEFNPDAEIVESIQYGLTRNKMIYGKRYCPCFFVQEEESENRICPCKPAIEHEIPEDGVCHCKIFCSPEFAAEQRSDNEIEEVVHQHSRGLSKEEAELLLSHQQLDSDQLTALLEARDLEMVKFNLLDVREWMEHKSGHIKGTDHLVPTTSFYDAVEAAKLDKSVPVIVYCHVGSRSAYCQRLLEGMEFEHIGNLTYGIVSYQGEIVR